MSTWTDIDTYTRDTLNLERDVTKMALVLRVEINLSNIANPIRVPITRNQTSVYLFRRHFETRMSLAEVQSISSIKMTVEQRMIFPTKKAEKTRKGQYGNQEKKTRNLGTILYGDGSAGKQQQEGELDE